MNKSASSTDEALKSIIMWSKSQAAWQRDALRRLLYKETLSQKDIDELLIQCKSKHIPPTSTDTQIESIPIDTKDLPLSQELESVSLRAILRIRNVNAIDIDSELRFQTEGLTVIYGDNGTGKSGYARILMNSCRSRAKHKKILPNIHDPSSVPPASAAIELQLGEIPRTSLWQDGASCEPLLSLVSIFDSECASVQVTETNEIAFKPFALQLLESLARVSTDMKQRLTLERNTLQSGLKGSIFSQQFRPTTQVGKIVHNLNAYTSVDELREYAQQSVNDQSQIQQLRDDLVEDPSKRMEHVQAQDLRLRPVIQLVHQIEEQLGRPAQEELDELHKDAIAMLQATKLAANKTFDSEALEGIGGRGWRALWESARRFSMVDAYPGKVFPYADPDAVCVLCLQPLSEAASQRLRDFEEYVNADIQQSAELAENRFNNRLVPITQLQLPATKSLFSSLGVELGNLKESLRKYIVIAKLRRRALLRLRRTRWKDTILELPQSPLNELESLSAQFKQRVTALRIAAQTGDRIVLENRLSDFKDRQTLRRFLPEIEKEIETKSRIKQLDAAILDTNTAPITRESTIIANDLITPKLRNAFADELQRLKITSSRDELVSVGGSYGAQRYQVQLLSEPSTSPDSILSEGEHCCVALAGFLAEVTTAPHKSALVLDDPVSSLDHRWRRFVADRIVEEANKRQVIVFTHDAVFLLNIMEHAKEKKVPLEITHLTRRSTTVGVPQQGAPWIVMKVKDRIGYLNQKLQDAEALLNKGQEQTYESLAKDLYGLLRETWERAIEEILLNHVIIRFSREVQTKRLKPLTDILDDDLTRIEVGMSKSSKYLRGHDNAAALSEEVPRPDEIRQDIADLQDWVKHMRNRGRQ